MIKQSITALALLLSTTVARADDVVLVVGVLKAEEPIHYYEEPGCRLTKEQRKVSRQRKGVRHWETVEGVTTESCITIEQDEENTRIKWRAEQAATAQRQAQHEERMRVWDARRAAERVETRDERRARQDADHTARLAAWRECFNARRCSVYSYPAR